MAKEKKLTIKDGKNLASKNNGLCLKSAPTSRKKWLWKCECGYAWYATYAQIQRGSWCPLCRKNKKTINDLNAFAKTKGGACLSDECINILTKVLWQCQLGHVWEAIPSNVLYKNKWCSVCAKNKKLSLELANEIAKKRNGECLSKIYKNSSSKLKWRCEGGHLFEMNLNAIRTRGLWCPYCNSWNAEEICRKYFETIFKCSFIKIRPKWLINKNNNKLELDGLSVKQIQNKYIAFEHQGLQHYISGYFPNNLENTQQNDEIKLKLCKENNCILFVIPHLYKITKICELKNIIKNICISNMIDISLLNFEEEISLFDIYLLSNKLKQYKKIIEEKGGLLLSKEYISAKHKIKIQCNNDHIWETSPGSIKSGTWCPICARLRRRKPINK